uniref:MADF domain-containing protein n=1 Tax=Timema monikensis TaxID=170555 RepID=A0A7R9E1I1_9NEOP|nr:unnamed protein product [Timema monikensis]
MAHRWRDETVMKFVNWYGSEFVLWDSAIVGYRNKTLQNEEVDRIVAEMGLHDFGVKECKLKIKNIRSHYWHEVGKTHSSTASGLGAVEIRCTNQKRKAEHSVSLRQNYTNIREEYDDPPSMEENVESASVPIPTQACPVPLHKKLKSASSQKDPPSHVQQALSKLQAISATAATFKETEFDSWAKSLAVQLNKMDVGRALELQLKLQTMVSEERITQYSTHNYSNPTQPPASHLAQIERLHTSRQQILKLITCEPEIIVIDAGSSSFSSLHKVYDAPNGDL